MQLSSNFIEWACSFSGCDGGNIDADIWLSGIEWGGAKENYYKELQEEISKGKYIPPEEYEWDNSLEYTYGRNVAKLFCAIKGKRVEQYKEIVSRYNGSELFMMNLYPIAFSNTDYQLWQKYALDKITGFKEKYLFKTWCFLHRFPFFARKTKQKTPKLIIGTGISYLTDFFVCFGGSSTINTTINYGEIKAKLLANSKAIRQYYWAKLNNQTTIVVIPFFSGQYGLNSNYLVQKTGDIIKGLIS